MKHAGQENKENDNQREDFLMYDQILSTYTLRNIWRTIIFEIVHVEC